MPNPTAVALDNLSHIIQVALTPIFLLSALATLLNVFATRHGRIGDQVRDLSQDLKKGPSRETKRLARQLSQLQRRSLLLDGAVCLEPLRVFRRLVGLVQAAKAWSPTWV
ncbi:MULTISPECIES: DUF2721 domain-containing protein [Methylobacterium]|jgi:hypothetical protein|nr:MULTISPECIES: DUF2721 domain-containing protein [Methylobacterium]MBK3399972.1 DUF2721 domain-containing protein [Methylobacterium ajmalii]MBK3423234.1 DUF2721 domain-containing protein [Methylobacterium ajmalii]